MRKTTATMIVGLFLTMIAWTVCARAEDALGVGSWVWNAKESHYATGAYASAQTMEISHLDKDSITVSQNVTLVGGQNFSWTLESPLDGKLRHASTWMSFAFTRVSDSAVHNRYRMDDGQEGEETFYISPNRIEIKGHSMKDGKQQPYVEIWDRVTKK